MKAHPLFFASAITILSCVAILLVGCGDDKSTSSNPNPSWRWSALGDGLSSQVDAIAEYEGRLYAGGYLYGYGGMAVFNRGHWESLGSEQAPQEINGSVAALIIYNNRLIATGTIYSAGGVAVSGIAAWDGSSWSPLAGGLPQGMSGYRMAIYNGKLYVGNSSITSTLFVVAWDGSSWTTVKTGGTGMVTDMCVYNNQLVVVADSTVNHTGWFEAFPWVRSWNGSSWTSMPGYGWEPRTLAVLGDSLYLGKTGSPYLMKWNGSAWVTASTAAFTDDEHGAAIYHMAAHNGKLVVGGDFDRIDGAACYNIATWDKTSFAPITQGLIGPNDPWVQALTCVGERLLVGGRFSQAGGVPTTNIAEWSYR